MERNSIYIPVIICLAIIFILSCQKTDTSSTEQRVQEEKLSYPNEPDGFRNIKWGDDISKMVGFKKVKKSLSDESFTMTYLSSNVYIKKNEPLSFGDVKVKSMRWHEFNNKLVAVVIEDDYYDTFLTLKNALNNKYGTPHKTKLPVKFSDLENKGTESYEWEGNKTNISLWYNHKTIREQLNNIGSYDLGYHDMIMTFEDAAHIRLVTQAREDYDKNNAEKASKHF